MNGHDEFIKISTLFGNVYETEQDCMGCRQRQFGSKLCIVPFGSTQN